jgi:hypothetical protein
MDYLDRLSQPPFDVTSHPEHEPPLAEPVLVSGDADSRKLLFASRSGQLHFVTVAEGYGERSASLTVRRAADGGAWHLVFNDKPFITFATEALAMAAYGEAFSILSGAFAAKAEPTSPVHGAPEESPDARRRAEWLSVTWITGSIVGILVLGLFAGSMLLRVADRVLPWYAKQGSSRIKSYDLPGELDGVRIRAVDFDPRA